MLYSILIYDAEAVIDRLSDEQLETRLARHRALQQALREDQRLGAGLPFEVPTAAERQQHLKTVASMIYLLFNEGYSASQGEAHIRLPLCQEAIRLARLLLRLFPAETEIMGLLALCLLQHSRRHARLNSAGELILLEDQDRGLWDQRQIAEGKVLLEKALRRGRPGPIQLQAAIAAVHASALKAEATDWREIDTLYGILERLHPSPVISLNRAVAIAKTRGVRAALASIEPLASKLDGYFHFHGVRASFYAELGETERAAVEFERARELARTDAEVAHLERRWQDLHSGS